jgi:cell division protein FtsI (penicillin-binding protein 3)
MAKAVKSGKSNKQILILRAYLVAAGMLLLGIAVLVKLIDIQFFDTYDGKTWKKRAEESRERTIKIPPIRGNIFSSDSSVLATSLPFYHVGLDAKTADSSYFEKHIKEFCQKFTEIYPSKSALALEKEIRLKRRSKGASRYLRLIPGTVDHFEREKIRQLPFFVGGKGGGGGVFETIPKRYKPFGQMASRTIGTHESDKSKPVGIEASFNSYLAGKGGLQLVELAEKNMKIPIGDFIERPVPGMDVYTSLDMNIQDFAESSLRKAILNFNADNGCVVVMEVATGEIKAIVNYMNDKGTLKDVFNFALQNASDPGSTFKVATLMAAAEEGKFNLDQEMVNTGSGRYNVTRSITVSDVRNWGYGTISAKKVLEVSSNVGTVLLAQKYFGKNPEKFSQYLDRFQLRGQTGIPMEGEVESVIKRPSDRSWNKSISLPFLSHGYEMKVTPLKMLTFYNAIANDGYMVRPLLVKQIRSSGQIVEEFSPTVSKERIASPTTIRQIQEALAGVVANGTAHKINSPYYSIAGKTGTAQLNGPKGPEEGKYHASFAGFFPLDKPKYSMIVSINNPKGHSIGSLYGGSVSAPVFKEIADRIYLYDVSLHNIPVEKPAINKATHPVRLAGYSGDVGAIASELKLAQPPAFANDWITGQVKGREQSTWERKYGSDVRIPDVSGLSLKDALFLLENKGYKVLYQGKGKVASQDYKENGPHKEVLLTLK